MKPAGLILAAGESRRMGSPKPLLAYRGESFLDRLIRLFSRHCDPVVVVLGARATQVRAATTQPALFVTNADYITGQTGSMQCGLRAVPPSADGVLFTLVDHPAVAPATLTALLAPPLPLIRIPRFNNQRGHPVWLSRELFAEILAVPVDGAARDVVRAHRAETEFIDLDDPGLVADIDDPAAYETLIGTANDR